MLQATKINTTTVANALGVSDRNVGTLCASAFVNKWSFWKPVCYPSLRGINDEVLYWVNDGFSLPNSDELFSNLEEAFANRNNNTYWVYDQPGDGKSMPGRLGDFRTYDHDQRDWFNMIVRGTDVTSVKLAPGESVSLAFNYPKQDKTFLTEHLFKFRCFMERIHGSYTSTGDGLMPNKFVQDLADNPKQQVSLTLGLIFRKPNQTGKEYLFYKMFDLMNAGDDGEELIVTIPDSGTVGNFLKDKTTYEVYPCITTYTSSNDFGKFEILNTDSDDDQWCIFPVENPLQITVDSDKQAELAEDITIDSITFVDDFGWNGTSLNSLRQIYCTITNTSDKFSYSGFIRTNIENMSGFGEIIGSFTNISAGETINVMLWNTKDETAHIEFATTEVRTDFTQTITHKDELPFSNPPVKTMTLDSAIITQTPTENDK